jgi:hypothetical protein
MYLLPQSWYGAILFIQSDQSVTRLLVQAAGIDFVNDDVIESGSGELSIWIGSGVALLDDQVGTFKTDMEFGSAPSSGSGITFTIQAGTKTAFVRVRKEKRWKQKMKR